MSSKQFKTGDLVAIVGGTVEKNEDFKKTAMVATVVVAGLHELFVEIEQSYSSYVTKVPIHACQKINVSIDNVTCKISREAEIGDLVLSYKNSSSFSSDKAEKLTGVLYKITYTLCKKDMCTVMSGTDFYDVKFDSLIVLQKS
jgi:hypothetical protein